MTYVKETPDLTEAVITLNEEQIRFFHTEGYLAIPAITTQDEVRDMRDIYDQLFAARTGREEGNEFDLAGADEADSVARLPQILGPSRYEPALAESSYRANAASISRQLLGPEAAFTGDHAILKPSCYGAPTPWHQDEAYWNPAWTYNALSVWMPLQPASIENGCMQFIPRSHNMPVLTHHSIGHDPRVHGLEVDVVDASKAVACPLPAGGATFHLARTLHYAGPNESDEPRRAYILTFGTPFKRSEEERDFYWNREKRTAREERAKQTASRSDPGVRA